MSPIMSQNWQKLAKMLHNAAKKFEWDTSSHQNREIMKQLQGYLI